MPKSADITLYILYKNCPIVNVLTIICQSVYICRSQNPDIYNIMLMKGLVFMQKSFLICGGDMRQVKLAESLAKDGYTVKAVGFDDPELFCGGVKLRTFQPRYVTEADVIVLPIPCSADNEPLNTPLQKDIIKLSRIFSLVSPGQIITGGRVSEKVRLLAEDYNLVIHDYLKREEAAILNAVPTAEGAIQIAMENMPITLHGSRALVLGFGRIGKLLCAKLKGLSVNVTCEARSCSDLAWIRSYGYDALHLDAVSDAAGGFDLIINTIPSLVITENFLSHTQNDALIIDLASKPGGVDMDAASRLGRRVIWALSLPGTVAPVTAGEVIKETVLNILGT